MRFTDIENKKLCYLDDVENIPSKEIYIQRLEEYREFYTQSFEYLISLSSGSLASLDTSGSLASLDTSGSLASLEYRINDAPHPLNFEIGHVVFFYDLHFLSRIMPRKLDDKIKYFDSLVNEPSMRENNPQLSIEYQLSYMNEVFDLIKKYLNNPITNKVAYILDVCLLHNEMHKEVIYFICQQMNTPLPGMRFTQPTLNKVENKWKRVNGGNFSQGLDKKDRLVVWDNECPKQEMSVKSFECQQYPVTYGEFIRFIDDNGYSREELWSIQGWRWNQSIQNNAFHSSQLETGLRKPINLIKQNGEWYRNWFGRQIPLDYSLPVTHISYYEAEAYARWMNARLPTETEYEYLLINGGETQWPWGNETDTSNYCNSNYQNTDIVPVGRYKHSANKWGVEDLMGNNWTWTSTRFYPYDGFSIDPIYDTFSYPFFYDRFVVRGSSWCVDDTLFHSKYRNAQEPEKRFHFTGIRLVRDL